MTGLQRKSLQAIILLCLATFALGAGTSGSEANVMFGSGKDSCGQWTADHTSGTVVGKYQEQWLLGYLSGISQWSGFREKDILAGQDFAGISAWVSLYCSQHPLEKLVDAADELVKVLKDQ